MPNQYCRRTVNERIRSRVGDAIARRVDRRLGYLTARVYWRKPGSDFVNKEAHYPWCEIPVWEFIDTGLASDGADGQEFVSEKKERTLDMRINKTWAVENRDMIQRFEYSVIYEKQCEHKACSFVGFEAKDADTHARLQLREVLIYSYHD
jgi:hypothetical protein